MWGCKPKPKIPGGQFFGERYLKPIPMQTVRPDSEGVEGVWSYVSSTGPGATGVVG